MFLSSAGASCGLNPARSKQRDHRCSPHGSAVSVRQRSGEAWRVDLESQMENIPHRLFLQGLSVQLLLFILGFCWPWCNFIHVPPLILWHSFYPVPSGTAISSLFFNTGFLPPAEPYFPRVLATCETPQHGLGLLLSGMQRHYVMIEAGFFPLSKDWFPGKPPPGKIIFPKTEESPHVLGARNGEIIKREQAGDFV